MCLNISESCIPESIMLILIKFYYLSLILNVKKLLTGKK